MLLILANTSVIGHPLGETPGKGGDFVQDPIEVLDFSLLEGDTEISKLRNSPSQMGITLKSASNHSKLESTNLIRQPSSSN